MPWAGLGLPCCCWHGWQSLNPLIRVLLALSPWGLLTAPEAALLHPGSELCLLLHGHNLCVHGIPDLRITWPRKEEVLGGCALAWSGCIRQLRNLGSMRFLIMFLHNCFQPFLALKQSLLVCNP